MKFATIIREAGYNMDEFKKTAEISLVLYDEKNRIESDENVHYAEKIFAKNLDSYAKFYSFLKELEEKPVDSISIMITEHHVIVLGKSQESKFFPRTIPLEPIDYDVE